MEILTSHFPSFDDSVPFGSTRLLFHKRAQLAPAMIHERWQGKGPGAFTDLEELTVSADYKLPQVLRKLGLIEYRNGLERMVDEGRVIPARSREENEIRAATIAAGEAMTAYVTSFAGRTPRNGFFGPCLSSRIAPRPSPNWPIKRHSCCRRVRSR